MATANIRGGYRPSPAASTPFRKGRAVLSFLVGLTLAGGPLFAQAYTGRLGVEAPNSGVFVDLEKENYRWSKPNGSGGWTGIGNTDVDANGWPTTDAQWVYDGRPVAEWAGTIDDPEQYRVNLSGVYHGSFTGQATVAADQGPFTLSNVSYDATTNTTTFLVTVGPPGPNHGLIALDFTNTKRNPGDTPGTGLTNFRLIRPGYDPNTTQVFTDAFFKTLTNAKFSTIRFMADLGINDNVAYDANGPITQSWANRKQVTDPGQNYTPNRDGGWAYEYIIDVCNRANMDLWLNVPAAVDDNYVQQLANLVKSRLNPNLNVYLEDGNEMWNFGFHQYAWNKGKAAQEVAAGGSNFNYDGSTDQEIWAQRRHAKRVHDIVAAFGAAFGSGSINQRVRGVLAGGPNASDPNGGPFVVGRAPGMLQYLKDNYGDPSGYIYAISEAAYYGGLAASGDPSTANDTVPQILADMQANIDSRVPERKNMVQLANSYHLPGGFCAYESGPDTGGGSTVNVGNRIEAVRDPQQAVLYKRNFAATFWDLGGNLAMQFGLAGSYSRFGTYGLTDDINIPDRNSLFQAVRDLIGAGPGIGAGGGGSTTPTDGVTYTLTNQASGLVLADPSSSLSNGTQMIQWPSGGYADQKWTLRATGNGWFALVNGASGLCLDDKDFGTTPGTPVQQWSCSGYAVQNWQFTAVGNGYYMVTNQLSNLVLDDQFAGTAPGTPVWLYTPFNNSAQHWLLQPVAP